MFGQLVITTAENGGGGGKIPPQPTVLAGGGGGHNIQAVPIQMKREKSEESDEMDVKVRGSEGTHQHNERWALTLRVRAPCAREMQSRFFCASVFYLF